jgi:NifU-like protein involved in Fe-S cluster formation
MVSEALRQLLVRGEGVGEFAGADVRHGRADHPVCGDEVQLSVRSADGRVLGVRWRAVGCPATLAISALAHKALVDVPLNEVAAHLHRAIADHGGLAAHERHAETMVLRALAAANGA